MRTADIDDARWYYAVDGEIRSCPQQSRCLSTDPATHIAPSQPNVASLAVDDINVYWVDGVAGNVMSTPKGGGPSATTLATGQNHPRRIVVDGIYLYLLNEGTGTDGQLARLRTDGKELTVLAQRFTWPRASRSASRPNTSPSFFARAA
jgi:hypothetical protein